MEKNELSYCFLYRSFGSSVVYIFSVTLDIIDVE